RVHSAQTTGPAQLHRAPEGLPLHPRRRRAFRIPPARALERARRGSGGVGHVPLPPFAILAELLMETRPAPRDCVILSEGRNPFRGPIRPIGPIRRIRPITSTSTRKR